MKHSINGIKYRMTFLTILLSLTLIGMSLRLLNDFWIRILVIGVTILIEIVLLVSIHAYNKRVNNNLIALSETIQSLIDDTPIVQFSDIEDQMLSKLQAQVIKLSLLLGEKADKALKEKEQLSGLISDISHQLKTPLSNIRLYESLLEDATLTDDQRRKFAKKKEEQLVKLEWLITSLIKMSKIETGMIQLNKEVRPLSKTILKAIDMATLKAEEKSMTIAVHLQDDVKINHDARWLSEALFNVIDNSVKYSPSGSQITVDMKVMELFAQVTVTDEGIGVDPSEQTNIFKRFYRINSESIQEGVGLGLYIAREIMMRHEGYITVDSSGKKGLRTSLFLHI